MEKQSDARPVHPRDQNVSKGSEPPVGGGSRSAGLTERWSALAARLLECRFSIADMARAQGLSVRQFERVFRRRFNCCPRHAAARLRMAIALQRLVTNARVKEIAAELGFYDSAHFCRAFHKYFGLRPSQLRRTMIKSRHTSIERERERTFCRGGPTCRSSTTKCRVFTGIGPSRSGGRCQESAMWDARGMGCRLWVRRGLPPPISR